MFVQPADFGGIPQRPKNVGSNLLTVYPVTRRTVCGDTSRFEVMAQITLVLHISTVEGAQ